MVSKIPPNKILITGANGSLGSYLKAGHGFSKEDLDVTNFSKAEEVVKREMPKVIIHLSALTNHQLCEDEKDFAYNVNTIGTYNMAFLAHEIGAKFVYISTNAVFDGNKKEPYKTGDLPNPIIVYGHSKYLGEMAVLDINPKNLIIRSSWIFGGGPQKDKKFIGKVIPKLLSGEDVQAVNDIRGTPTYGKDLASAIYRAIDDDLAGIVHIINGGNASRYDMALVAKESVGSSSKIIPTSFKDFPGIFKGVLINEMLGESFYNLRSWDEALSEYLKEEWK